MEVLLVEPGKEARIAEIGSDLKSLQAAVGGYIEAAYFFDDPVALICNEEGKVYGLPYNRAIRDEAGKVQDIHRRAVLRLRARRGRLLPAPEGAASQVSGYVQVS